MRRAAEILKLTAAAAVCAAALAACSTTSRIPSDDMLYTGVKKVVIAPSDSAKIPADVASSVRDAVDVAPNNYIKMFRWRYPFPYGLWVYNHWNEPKKGIGKWLYDKLVEEPVLVSDVRPEVRTHMIEQILDNNGYFRGKATYSLVQGRNKKKAKILYDVQPGPEYPVCGLQLLPDSIKLYRMIDSLALEDDYLSADRPRYCTDSLSAARVRITNELRNRGYYYFRPEYIEYLADSIVSPGEIELRLTLDSSLPKFAMEQYRTGNITLHVGREQGGGVPDTISLSRAILIQMLPSKLRAKTMDECITFRKNRIFSVRNMNRTQSNLSRLGIFRTISIEAVPDTTVRDEKLLNVDIFCTFDMPLETSLEVNVSSKSNSYIGPGASFGVTNKNIFGGGEQLSVKVNGTYEWQTGKGKDRSLFNSYEVGLTGSLAFPRLLAPKFVPRSRYQLNWTRFQLNADLLNRPHYFKMAQFNASVNYDWRLRRYVSNTLTLFKLTYTNLMHTTADFDSIMDANPAVAQSFRSQFIPQMMYTYVYDRMFDADNGINWQFTAQEAGNVFWAIYRACGIDGEKRLFGTPFSQFVKGQTQLVYNRRLTGEHWLVGRVAAGAAYAYGNSTEVPYAEQFYVGGANSVRAFTVRSIGPGSYAPPAGQPDDYFDRTGTFKFEANVEYRFPIVGPLHGALFVDAGNVWLLKDDPMRPGGTLRGSTFLRDLALGTGFGLRFDISMLVIRGDLGIGIHAPYDTGKRGYYNMKSFGNSLAFHLAIGYPF